MFYSLISSAVSFGARTTYFFPRASVSPMILTRNLMKTHKGAAKRWKKTAYGFKRGKAGRNHGNAGWSRNSLKCLSGKALADSTHTHKLKRLLPYH